MDFPSRYTCVIPIFIGLVLGTNALAQSLPATTTAPATATQPVKVPDVKASLGEYEKELAAAKADYDKAVAAAKNNLIKKLKLAMDGATKAGNLDEAIAIRDKIRELQAPPEAPPAKAATIPAKPKTFMPSGEVVGTWLEFNGTPWVFSADGAFDYASGMGKGSWVLDERGLVITFVKGWPGQVRTYTALTDGTLTGHYNSGPASKVLSMKKVEPPKP